MYLKRGKRGNDVQNLQYALHLRCCPPGNFDGIFGLATDNAVREYQAIEGLAQDGIVGDVTWERLSGELKMICRALKAKGCSLVQEDGNAAKELYEAVLEYQRRRGLLADGMVGPKTMEELGVKKEEQEYVRTGTVSEILKYGSDGSLTGYLQRMLGMLGYEAPADSIYGSCTRNAVTAFQKAHGLVADGVVGRETWKKLFAVYRIPGLKESAAGMAKAARHELSWGFSEDYGNDITPYGIWYGMDGEPWCAMFVSWCAHQAGILGSLVPRFAYCPYGVYWYREHGRFARKDNYTPGCGDTIFFGSLTSSVISHTGIVVAVDDATVTAIEGNSNNCVRKRTYGRKDSYIYGYGVNRSMDWQADYIV